MKKEMFCKERHRDEDKIVFCSSLEDFIPQHSDADCTTISIYQINYAVLTMYMLGLVVVMITVACLLKGRRARILKTPTPDIYYLCKTSYKEDHFRLCKTLIENEDYDVNYLDAEKKLSLFLCACVSGNTELISFMLKRGVNINILSCDNDSAFYLACSTITPEKSDFDILDILLSAGSDINMQNNNGFTALHLACSRGHELLVVYLMKNVLPQKAETQENSSTQGSFCGANPLIPTFNQVLPHQLALANSHMDIAEYVHSKIEDKNS